MFDLSRLTSGRSPRRSHRSSSDSPSRCASPARSLLERLELRQLLSTVGYYDIYYGEGRPEQVADLTSLNHEAVLLQDISTESLTGLDGLVIQHYGILDEEYQVQVGDSPVDEFTSSLGTLHGAIEKGLTLLLHDSLPRSQTHQVLPGMNSATFVSTTISRGNWIPQRYTKDVNFVATGTLISDGPAGTLTDSSLDAPEAEPGYRIFNGWADASTLPADAEIDHLLSAPGFSFGAAYANIVPAFSYSHGAGRVVYSTITQDSRISVPNATIQQALAVYEANLTAFAFGIAPAPVAGPVLGELNLGSTSLIEGSTLSLSGSFVNDDPDGTHTLTIDWGDGSEPSVVSLLAGIRAFNVEHTYTADSASAFAVTVTLADDDGGSVTSEALSVTVENSAPVWQVAPVQVTGVQGEVFGPFALEADDAGLADVLSVDVVDAPAGVNLDVVWDAELRTGTLVGTADIAGAFNVTLRVADEGGFSDTQVIRFDITDRASVSYSGQQYVSTPSTDVTTATVALRATLHDLDGVGDITNATVTFFDRDTGADIATVAASALNGDPLTGVASYNWTYDLGNAESAVVPVGVRVDGGYVANSEAALVTVTRPGRGKISGGGSILNDGSAGWLAGAAGTKSSFGFDARYQNGQDGLVGTVNLMIPSYGLPDGSLDGQLHLYYVESTSIESLITYADTAGVAHAAFAATVQVWDATDSSSPVLVADNLSLEMTLTDGGKQGQGDTLRLSVWDNTDSLFFANNWADPEQDEQALSLGDLKVWDKA